MGIACLFRVRVFPCGIAHCEEFSPLDRDELMALLSMFTIYEDVCLSVIDELSVSAKHNISQNEAYVKRVVFWWIVRRELSREMKTYMCEVR